MEPKRDHLGLNLDHLGHKWDELGDLDDETQQKINKKIENRNGIRVGSAAGADPLSRSLTKIFDLDKFGLLLQTAPQGCGAG